MRKAVRAKQAAKRESLPFVGDSLELAKLMDKLSRGEGWKFARCSESDYMSGDFTVRAGRKKVARTNERTLQSAFFFLYCRVYYRTSVGYRGRRV